jgi:quinolinate synthase
MQKEAPGKIFIEAPTAGVGATCKSCAQCPWMAMNYLTNLLEVIETEKNEIDIDPDIREKAVVSLTRMLDFSEEYKLRLQPGPSS